MSEIFTIPKTPNKYDIIPIHASDISTFLQCRSKYLVTDDGRVFSTHKWNNGDFRELKQEVLKSGYHRVTLQTEQGTRKILVHVLVLQSFIAFRPNHQEVRHLDGDKSNNRLDNLCWGTREENIEDSRRHGTFIQGSKHGNSKLTEEQVKDIRKEIAEGIAYPIIAEYYGVTRHCISNIASGRRWKHVK